MGGAASGCSPKELASPEAVVPWSAGEKSDLSAAADTLAFISLLQSSVLTTKSTGAQAAP